MERRAPTFRLRARIFVWVADWSGRFDFEGWAFRLEAGFGIESHYAWAP